MCNCAQCVWDVCGLVLAWSQMEVYGFVTPRALAPGGAGTQAGRPWGILQRVPDQDIVEGCLVPGPRALCLVPGPWCLV